MHKPFSNKTILEYATSLTKNFLEEGKDVELPVVVNFYLQKNIKTFIEAAEEIDEARLKIGEKYGEYNFEEDCYEIRNNEKRLQAQDDLKKLLSIDQVLEIHMISLEDLKDTHLTVAQMNAMLFMIEE